MNFNRFIIILVLLFLNNCTNNVKITSKQFQESDKFTNKGFALIFDENLFKDDIISKRIDNRSYTIFQKNIKKNSDVKVTNLLNNKSLIAKVKSNKANYPLFFNSVITQRISEDLEIDAKDPYVEIQLISNNSSFVAKKSKIWEEEREVAEKAPVDGIEINDLNKVKLKKNTKKIDKFSYSIKIADFYYETSAIQMLDRIKNETSLKKFKIVPLSKTNFRVILGPFSDINSLKNSYNDITVLNFENLEIIRHD
tara:strand:- start:57 stop:815 length:759 start_codon:yes stop_codon:yes gene_type:complete